MRNPSPFRMRTLFPAEGPRRVWPALVIKPRDFHVSTVWLADRWPLLRNRRIFSSPVRDGCHSLVWSARAAWVVPNQFIQFIAGHADCCVAEKFNDLSHREILALVILQPNEREHQLLYPSKEVARGHSEVAVINLSDGR